MGCQHTIKLVPMRPHCRQVVVIRKLHRLHGLQSLHNAPFRRFRLEACNGSA